MSSYYELARLAQVSENYGTAYWRYQQALEIATKIDNKASIAVIAGQLANLAKMDKNYVKAEGFYRYAIEQANIAIDMEKKSIYMLNLALLYEEQARLDEALQLLEASIEIIERINHPKAPQARIILKRVRAKSAKS